MSRTIFNLFDVNGDQSITFEELGVVLRSMGHNPSEKELIDLTGTLSAKHESSGRIHVTCFGALEFCCAHQDLARYYRY